MSYPGIPIVKSTAVGPAVDQLARKRSGPRPDNDSDATADAADAIARLETRMAMMESDMAELRQLASAQSQQFEQLKAMLKDREPKAKVCTEEEAELSVSIQI